MTSLKLAFAVTLAAAVVACSAAPSTEVPDVDVHTDTTNLACKKGSILCGGDNPPLKKGTSIDRSLNVDVVLVPLQPENRGPEIPCTGPGPEGNEAEYVVTKPLGSDEPLQCWSGRLIKIDGGIPSGLDLLSLYICPSMYPVNRCDLFGRCYCWRY